MKVTPLQAILQFSEQRSWRKYHTPRNLAIFLLLEAAEVLELFQRENDKKVSTSKKHALAKELADVYSYLLLLANTVDIDLEKAFFAKMRLNRRKYPQLKTHLI